MIRRGMRPGTWIVWDSTLEAAWAGGQQWTVHESMALKFTRPDAARSWCEAQLQISPDIEQEGVQS